MTPLRPLSAARRTATRGAVLVLVAVPVLVAVLVAVLAPVRPVDVPDRPAASTTSSVTGPSATATPVPTPAKAVPPVTGPPVELRIPSLRVRAPVVGVGLAADGALVPPPDPRLVGWWRSGARPGSSRGAAVLAGHTVHDGGGVFDDLADLAVGDAVEVLTDEQTLVFEVRTVRDLGRAELAGRAGLLFSREGRSRLVLVTCTDWDGEGYRGNTVVVARTD